MTRSPTPNLAAQIGWARAMARQQVRLAARFPAASRARRLAEDRATLAQAVVTTLDQQALRSPAGQSHPQQEDAR